MRSLFGNFEQPFYRFLRRIGRPLSPIGRLGNYFIAQIKIIGGYRYGNRFSHTTGNLINSFSIVERIVFFVFIIMLTASAGILAWEVNIHASSVEPSVGGSFTEGVIGSPRFINPLLAVSDADQDLVSLIYAGPLKKMPDGTLVLDLAENIEVSEDAMTFTVTLRTDAVFHDGEPVSARDLAFTVDRARDPQLRSPVRGDWNGVDIEITGEHTVTFTLDEPYAPFLENLTLGILPAHLWNSLSASQFPSSPHNDSPIGAGPYRVNSFTRDQETAATTYELAAFDNYVHGKPYISSITVRSFTNKAELYDALKNGDVDSASGIDPAVAEELIDAGVRINTGYLPRIFGVFFNHNKNDIFSDTSLRQALSSAVDKEAVIEDVLAGYGASIASPAPRDLIEDIGINQSAFATSSLDTARELLDDAGWTNEAIGSVRTNSAGDPLSFTLTTADTPELTAIANAIRDTWQEVGIDVTVNIFSGSDLNQEVIRPRNYEALLFGEIIGGGRDFFPFWHSSQLNDPGLNIAQYSNTEADEILEVARQTADPKEQDELYRQFIKIVTDDHPAVFLYTPSYIYAAPSTIQNLPTNPTITSNSRFATVHQWYVDTQRVWNIFASKETDREYVNILQAPSR
ncbi:MAG: peptide ABC transporter substrate-binding protein [Candidatus Paceibacterota bacterium]